MKGKRLSTYNRQICDTLSIEVSTSEICDIFKLAFHPFQLLHKTLEFDEIINWPRFVKEASHAMLDFANIITLLFEITY